MLKFFVLSLFSHFPPVAREGSLDKGYVSVTRILFVGSPGCLRSKVKNQGDVPTRRLLTSLKVQSSTELTWEKGVNIK